MSDFDTVQEKLLMITRSDELQNEQRVNQERILELEERNRLIGHEIIRRLSSGAI